jgi:hypothetical protein
MRQTGSTSPYSLYSFGLPSRRSRSHRRSSYRRPQPLRAEQQKVNYLPKIIEQTPAFNGIRTCTWATFSPRGRRSGHTAKQNSVWPRPRRYFAKCGSFLIRQRTNQAQGQQSVHHQQPEPCGDVPHLPLVRLWTRISNTTSSRQFLEHSPDVLARGKGRLMEE